MAFQRILVKLWKNYSILYLPRSIGIHVNYLRIQLRFNLRILRSIETDDLTDFDNLWTKDLLQSAPNWWWQSKEKGF